MITTVATVASLAAAVLAGVRWLRVAQREHYWPGTCGRFARRWWWGFGYNRILLVGVVVNLVLTAVSSFFGILVALAIAVGPLGLRLRGRRPGPLRWTRRLRTAAVIAMALAAGVSAAGALAGVPAFAAALVALLAPMIVDAALWVAWPLERRLGRRHVERAAARLREVAPLVIALTGSYGKTTTKGYLAHLLGATRAVVASPASFNNSAGLARAVNEGLASGTEVFVAEMGTYGRGEIADLCSWVQPSIAAITAIGPVHLERMDTLEDITEAKAEIFSASATTAVLNIDDPHLRALAERLSSNGTEVIRCSVADRSADVWAVVDGDEVVVGMADSGEVARGGA